MVKRQDSDMSHRLRNDEISLRGIASRNNGSLPACYVTRMTAIDRDLLTVLRLIEMTPPNETTAPLDRLLSNLCAQRTHARGLLLLFAGGNDR